MKIPYGQKTVFTQSAITPPKSESIWMKSGADVSTLLGAGPGNFGRDPRSSDSLRGS